MYKGVAEMKDIYLVRYSVKGIKTLKELVTLSFYKKTFAKNMDTRGYNVNRKCF